jgi:[lysine-biosynthesis-protein LysW]---L-2-aminoadipate ligase
MSTLALLHSTIRREEKLLLDEAARRGIPVKIIDIRAEVLDPAAFRADFDVALERSVSTVKGDYAALFLESVGIPVVNPSLVARNCGDKFRTSLLLARAGVPSPKFAMAFEPEAARRAIAGLGGFPVVIKPALGSWGRLLAKINDEDALDAVVEHKDVLGTPPQKALYIQEFVRKPGRDIRAFTADGEMLCAIYRESPHWITNTARGGVAKNCPPTSELRDVCARASAAVGGGLLAIDLFESDGGLLVNEINHTMEFRNSEEPTGVSISGAILDHCMKKAKGA